MGEHAVRTDPSDRQQVRAESGRLEDLHADARRIEGEVRSCCGRQAHEITWLTPEFDARVRLLAEWARERHHARGVGQVDGGRALRENESLARTGIEAAVGGPAAQAQTAGAGNSREVHELDDAARP